MADSDWTVKFGFDDDVSSCRLVAWQAVANTSVTICGREYKKGDMIHLRCDDGVNYRPVDGPDPTYRIKPLAWEDSRQRQSSWEARTSAWVCEVVYQDGMYHWTVEDVHGCGPDRGCEDTFKAASLAAESAYRKLVAEHLEVVG